MVKSEKVVDGIVSFAEAELLPSLSGLRLLTGSAALLLLRQRADAVFDALKEDKVVMALGLIDKNGDFDVDTAADALKEAAKKQGKVELDIPLLGAFKFGEADIEKLRDHIKNA